MALRAAVAELGALLVPLTEPNRPLRLCPNSWSFLRWLAASELPPLLITGRAQARESYVLVTSQKRYKLNQHSKTFDSGRQHKFTTWTKSPSVLHQVYLKAKLFELYMCTNDSVGGNLPLPLHI